MASFAGYKLTTLREERGWDQKTLAKLAGLSTTVVSSLETGRTAHPRPATIKALTDALGCEPRALYKRGRNTTRQHTPPPAPPQQDTPALFPAPAEPARTVTHADLDRLLHDLPARWRILFDGCREVGFITEQAMQLVVAAITAGTLP